MTDWGLIRRSVPALLLLLLAVPAPTEGAEPSKPSARAAAARTQLTNFRTAIELYRVDHAGDPPPVKPGLTALIRRPTGDPKPQRWKGPYLKDPKIPLDPWGHAYVYQVPGTKGRDYTVLSYGADGKPGGQGDNQDLSTP